MDDQLLEKRLDSLKKAYDEMPEDENRSAILAAIKKDQKKHTKQKWFHLPYAASFIGVGMIAGVLMMQYIGEQEPSEEKTEQHQAAPGENRSGELKKSDVKAVFDDLEKYYQERELQTKEKLGFLSGFENYLYRNIPMELNDEEAAFLSNLEAYKQTDLEDTRERLTSEIDNAFTMPSEMIDKLLQEKNGEVSMDGPEYTLLNQLESFLGAYYLSMTYYENEINKAIENENVERVIKKMNDGGKGITTANLKEMSAKAVGNGYAFREEEGRIVPYVNFSGIAERLRGAANDDFIKYLELRANRVQDFNGDVISFENLADVLVKLEKTISTVKDEAIEERMKNDAKSLYALFVVSPHIYDKNDEVKDEVKAAYLYMQEAYPDTDTAAAVYKRIQSNHYKKPADGEELEYPMYLELPDHIKREDVIDRNVLPLPDSLLSSYKEFAAKKNFNILKHYGPFEIMQLYFQADQAEDFETKYALYSRQSYLPPKEEYLKEMKEADPGMTLSKTLKGYQFATLYHSADDPEKVIGIQLHYTDRTDGPVFQLVQEDGFWKVQYLPIQ